MDVYFDNNALSHLLARHGVSDDEFNRLRAAKKDGGFAPKLSFVNIDEAIAAIVNHETLALDLVRLIADFVGLDTMIKPPDQLLTDDLIALAFGDPRRPAEIQTPPAIRQHLDGLLGADPGEVATFAKAAAETRDQIDDLWAGLRRARDQARAELGRRYKAERFGKYWREIAPALVEAYADHVGVWRLCRDEVGIDELLACPSVGMMVGANASMIYSRVVEGRAAKHGDSRDQQHALMASAADVFVTDDGDLRHILQRVPLIAPTVVDLGGLLVTLGIR
jgi:hypothetical protein